MRDRICFIETFTPNRGISQESGAGFNRDDTALTKGAYGRGASSFHSWLGFKCIGGAECCVSRSHGDDHNWNLEA